MSVALQNSLASLPDHSLLCKGWHARAVTVLVAVHVQTTGKYAQRGVTYAHKEARAAAENISLQPEALHPGAIFIRACHDEQLQDALPLPNAQTPLALLPVGHPVPAE